MYTGQRELPLQIRTGQKTVGKMSPKQTILIEFLIRFKISGGLLRCREFGGELMINT